MAGGDSFKESFKVFKKLSLEELRTKVIDFTHPDKLENEVYTQDICVGGASELCVCKAAELGLRPPHQWKVYTLKTVPGLLLVPNPFLVCGQHHWVKRCLVDYPIKPNICNLDAHMTRPGNGQLWPHPPSATPTSETMDNYAALPRVNDPDLTKCTRYCAKNADSAQQNVGTTPDSGCTSMDVCTKGTSHEEHQDHSDATAHGVRPSTTCDSIKNPRKKRKLCKQDSPSLPAWLSKESMLYKLRWVTLGYHYDWATKEYSPHKVSTFPEELRQLSAFVLEALGFADFRAEAGIVNYYHLDSTLSGHTDHSEKDLSRPLLSISLGQSALFLIGGQTKQVPPLPLLLNSGDIVVMSGDSRLAYHGIPKVFPPSPDHTVPYSLSKQSLEQCVCWKTREHASNSQPRNDLVLSGAENSEIRSSSETKEKGGAITKDNACSKESAESAADRPVCEDLGTASRLDAVIAHGPSDTGAAVHESAVHSDCGVGHCPICCQLAGNWDMFVDYLSVSRININVRQVVSEKIQF